MSKEVTATDVSNKIKKLQEIGHQFMKEIVELNEEAHVAGERQQECLRISSRLKKLEDDVRDMQPRLESLEAFRSKLSKIFADASDISMAPEIMQPSAGVQDGCGEKCCSTISPMTASGVRIFCGLNMNCSTWVNHVDQMRDLMGWSPREMFLCALEALTGKAKENVLDLVKKYLREQLEDLFYYESDDEKYRIKADATSERKLNELLKGRVLDNEVDWYRLNEILKDNILDEERGRSFSTKKQRTMF